MLENKASDRSKQKTHRLRGFIAAPLIGTVIFLGAIVFIVNLQNIEAQSSLRIANDAYHNRVASVLEEHRSDLSSIFREGLSRTIAYYVLSRGWSEFFWNNDPNGHYTNYAAAGLELQSPDLDENHDGIVSLKELRYGKCESIKALTSDVICSIPNIEGEGTQSAQYKYGLPQWMSKFSERTGEESGLFVFEGITFKTSNPDQLKVFLPTQPSDFDTYRNYCLALLRGSVFDCKDFSEASEDTPAQDKFKCVDHDANGNNIPDENADDIKTIPGCKEGNFFVKINVENTFNGVDVYPKLPRVEASDTSGNTVRSSGIGDKNFYLPINLRIFKYYDETFKVYSRLAYGASGDGGNRNEGEDEGVADGQCGGPNSHACEDSQGFRDDGYPPDLTRHRDFKDNAAVREAVAEIFFDKVFKPACERSGFFQNAPDRDDVQLRACPPEGCAENDQSAGDRCDENADWDAIHDHLKVGIVGEQSFSPGFEACFPPGGGAIPSDQYCAYYGGTPDIGQDSFEKRFVLVDNDPAFRIDPVKPVMFNWGVTIQHDVSLRP